MRVVFISCLPDEETIPGIQPLCGFLQASGCTLTFGPPMRWTYHESTESLIEQCDAFVAVITTYNWGSSNLKARWCYAAGLQGLRMRPRPRVFGLILDHLDAEQLSIDVPTLDILSSPQDFGKIIQDLPARADRLSKGLRFGKEH